MEAWLFIALNGHPWLTAQHSRHTPSIDPLEHDGKQIERDSDQQDDVAVYVVVPDNVCDRQGGREDARTPVHPFCDVHLCQQSLAISSTGAETEVWVDPAERRMQQYESECPDARAIVNLAFLLPTGQGEQLAVHPEDGAQEWCDGNRSQPRAGERLNKRIAV